MRAILKRRPAGMRGFTIVWFGQILSFLGTGMTNFALSFWIFGETGEAAALTWAIFFFVAPSVLLSPVAGAIVDRTSRKKIMILSDLAAGLVTIVWLAIMAGDGLQIWHIYVGNAISGAFNAFQFPAYSAAVTLMLPKTQYARAQGMLSLAGSASEILAPALAGALLSVIGLAGIMAIDVISFIIAIGTLLLVIVPDPPKATSGSGDRGSLLQESVFGFRYIFDRPSLLGLQLVFLATNLTATFGIAIMVPMILARTSNNEVILATVQSVGAVGGVVGGLLLTAWGGPRRKVHGVLLGMLFASLTGEFLMGIGRAAAAWAAAAFAVQFFIPFINGSNQAIWQAKVEPHVQGRVFAVRRLIAQVTAPLAFAVAGPAADNLFEPALRSGGSLSATFGWLVGVGPGSGMSLMLVIVGILGATVALGGYAFAAVRNAEDILPDHDTMEPSMAVT